LVGNLIFVTTGHIFGGGFMGTGVFWFIYRCPRGGHKADRNQKSF
jgi:formate/nitrite transporter FocA (FNT family)